jgi:hypothetical protein
MSVARKVGVLREKATRCVPFEFELELEPLEPGCLVEAK